VELWGGDVVDCDITTETTGPAILAEPEAEGTISGCLVTVEHGTAISLHGGIMTVTNNTIRVTDEYETNIGVLSEPGTVQNDDQALVSDCFISVPNGIGIDVETPKHEVAQCTIDDTKWGVMDLQGGVVRNSIATNCYQGFTTTSTNKAEYCIGWPAGYGFGPNSQGTTSVEQDPLYCGSGQYTLRVDSYGNPGNNDSAELIGAFPVACMFGTLVRSAEYLGNGTLYVPGDVTIPSAKSLTLDAGTAVRMRTADSLEIGSDYGEVELIVNSGATLTISGTSGTGNQVSLTSNAASPAEGDWWGIQVNSGGTASIDYAILEYSDYGIRFQSRETGHISHSSFEYNTNYDIVAGSGSGTMALSIDHNSIGVGGGKGIELDSYVRGVTIEANSIIGDAPPVYSSQGINFGGFTNGEYPTITGNFIQSFASGYGIFAAAAAPTIEGNEIESCGYGIQTKGGTALIGSATNSSSDNLIHQNFIGVRVKAGTAKIRNNQITDNWYGVVNDSVGNADLGTSSSDQGNNTFSGNSNHCIENDNGSVTLRAQGNYFGSCNPNPPTCWSGNVDTGNYLCQPPAGVDLAVEALPTRFALQGVFPNPMRGTGHIAFNLPAASDQVQVRVFDLAGRVVRDFGRFSAGPGKQEVAWDGLDDRGVPVVSGIYFIHVQAGNHQAGAAKALVMR
jgi:uncharacterized protein DUF1565/flagellar hook capping protein FlgD